jgi:integrase
MLTELKIKNAKPGGKPYKLYDADGLYLYITPKGTKSWRLDYKFKGKRKTLTLGRYPFVSLKEARFKKDKVKRALLEGKEPASDIRKTTWLFESVALKWYETSQIEWKPSHAKTVLYRLKNYILPVLGKRDISEIKRAEILELIEKIKITGKKETARRVYQIINSIFTYALDHGLTDRIPSHGLVKYVGPSEQKHFPTILDPKKIGKLLLDIDLYHGDFIVKCALKVLILTFVRPGELRFARWSEFNLEEAVWDVPADRMKIKRPHRVFLSRQAVENLQKIKSLPPSSEYVFRGRNPEKPISENTLNRALRSMGYNTKSEITAHGFRAMARTLIHEKLGYSPEVIEHQLGHRVPDLLGEAYNRTRFYEQRKRMMQDWADYLDRLKEEAKSEYLRSSEVSLRDSLSR